jgi:hypothetical protein
VRGGDDGLVRGVRGGADRGDGRVRGGDDSPPATRLLGEDALLVGLDLVEGAHEARAQRAGVEPLRAERGRGGGDDDGDGGGGGRRPRGRRRVLRGREAGRHRVIQRQEALRRQ